VAMRPFAKLIWTLVVLAADVSEQTKGRREDEVSVTVPWPAVCLYKSEFREYVGTDRTKFRIWALLRCVVRKLGHACL